MESYLYKDKDYKKVNNIKINVKLSKNIFTNNRIKKLQLTE